MEKHFPKILVYKDALSYSNIAISRAVSLAEKNSSKITVVDVIAPLPAFWDSFETDFHKTEEQVRSDKLRNIIDSFGKPDLFEPPKILRGRPSKQIVMMAVEGNFDLVVKKANARQADTLFGNVDLRLSRQCPVPVLLVNPDAPPVIQRVLVAVDPAATDSEKILNGNLIHYASSVAQLQNARLYLVGAWQSPYYAGTADEDYDQRYERYQKHIKRDANIALQALAAESLRPFKKPEDVILEQGPPEQAILETAERVKPDLLVMGSIGRSGVMGFLMGNTAERVIREVKCSLLIVKPPGFVSALA